MLQIEVLTLFPDIFTGFSESSLIGRAARRDLLQLTVTNIRDYASPPHYQVDDVPYGGGAGMLMKPEPLSAAIEAAKSRRPRAPVVLLSPAGRLFTQAVACEFAALEQLILVCGRYEGVDQRVVDLLVDQELSIGDYVLMGGEVPAMAVIEAVARLRDQVLGNRASLYQESFAPAPGGGLLLEAPQYTRPPVFRGLAVPEVLISGDHRRIAAWKAEQSLALTRRRRPDLLCGQTRIAEGAASQNGDD